MKTYTDNKRGYQIDLPNDWRMDDKKPPIISGLLFRIIYGGPLTNGLAFIRGSNETLETLNISVEAMPPGITPEATQQFFMEYVHQAGYAGVSFGRILVGGKEHTWARYQIAENVWSKKYMIVLNGVGYAITACFKDNGTLYQKEAEWDVIARSLQLR